MNKDYLGFFFFLLVCFISSSAAGPIFNVNESSLFKFSKKKSCPYKPKKIKIQGFFGKIYIKPSASRNLQLEYENISDGVAESINVAYYSVLEGTPLTQRSRLNIDASGIHLKHSSQKSALYRSASFGPFSKQVQALAAEQSKLRASDRVEIEKKEAANAIFHIHLPSSVDELELAATTFPIIAQFESNFDKKLAIFSQQDCKLVDSSIKKIDASVMKKTGSLVLDKTYAEALNVRLVNGGILKYINSSIREEDIAKIEVEVSGKVIYGAHELVLGAGKTDLKKLDVSKSKK